MIQICKTPSGQFMVANVAKNGELLKPSETFTRKAACWKNIISEATSCYRGILLTSYLIVQDNTGKKPVVYTYAGKRVLSAIQPQKPYVPKSRKKKA